MGHAGEELCQTRFSGLNQINAGNADKLRRRLDLLGRLRSWPGSRAHRGRRHDVCRGAYPNELFALDATTGDLKWKYSPRVDPSSQGVACCDVVNRGAVYDNGKIFFNTLDNHTVAVDAKTGKEVWARQARRDHPAARR